ncbi:hypothetical protein VTL71DRAFT_16545 [Oculimacula yallundae]|uniref:Uncharacterized protein n=1 Tax=Oculimacula yallundae TaxID=86028 RepID=A0ABR4CFZ5_9HELO
MGDNIAEIEYVITSIPPTASTNEPRNLPSLKYDLRKRKVRILIFWSMVLLDSMIIPIVLYFLLWKGSGLDHDTVYLIISATLAGTSILEYFWRFWLLGKKSSSCRVRGAKWWHMDSVQYMLSPALICIVMLAVYGGLPPKPNPRMLALVAPAFIFVIAVEILIIDVLFLAGIKSPVRLSSVPRRRKLRPGIYFIVEDVIAVNGGGGTEYRERLEQRYLDSIQFRRLMIFMSFFWSLPAIIVATITVLFVLRTNRSLAYVLGPVVPFLWAIMWTAITFCVAKQHLYHERATWRRELRGGIRPV